MQAHLLRPKLLESIDAFEQDVIVIDAPNGFGKSVLVSQYMACHPDAVLLRLQDRHAFGSSLVTDLAKVLSSRLDHQIDDLLDLAPSKGLINLFNAVPDQILVLDGGHHLSTESLLAVRALIGSMALKRLVLTTHDYDSLNFGRFEDRVARLSSRDLLFSLDDIRLLAEQFAISVDATTILQDTAGRGQFVALTLAAIRNKRPTRRVYVDLVEDLYAQDSDFFDQLTQFSLIPEWDVQTPTLFGIEFGFDYLAKAMALDVPLLPLDNGRYQLHQIFRETLFERLNSSQRVKLYGISAKILETQEQFIDALRYYSLAEQYDVALVLLRQQMINAEQSGNSLLMDSVIASVDFDRLVLAGYASGDGSLQSVAGFVDVFRAFVSFQSYRPDVGADQLQVARSRAIPEANPFFFDLLDIVYQTHFLESNSSLFAQLQSRFIEFIESGRFSVIYNFFAAQFELDLFYSMLESIENPSDNVQYAQQELQIDRLIYKGQFSLASTILLDSIKQIELEGEQHKDFYYPTYQQLLTMLAYFRGDFVVFFELYQKRLAHVTSYQPSAHPDTLMFMVAYHQLIGDWQHSFYLMQDVLRLVEDLRLDASPYKLAMYEIEARLGKHTDEELGILVNRVKLRDTYTRVLRYFLLGQIAFRSVDYTASIAFFTPLVQSDFSGYRLRALQYLKYAHQHLKIHFVFQAVFDQLSSQIHSSMLALDVADFTAQSTQQNLPIFYDLYCRTLGAHELLANGQKVKSYPQQLQLLIYMLKDGFVSKQDALDIFFAQAKDPNTALKNVVSQLRTTLAGCLPNFSARAIETVIFENNAYRLNPSISGQLDLSLLPSAPNPFEVYRGAFLKNMDLPDSFWLRSVRESAWLTLEDRVREIVQHDPDKRLPFYQLLTQYQFDFSFPETLDPDSTYFDKVVKLLLRQGGSEALTQARSQVQAWLDAYDKYGINPPNTETLQTLGLDTALVA
jgi:hypothetical protein